MYYCIKYSTKIFVIINGDAVTMHQIKEYHKKLSEMCDRLQKVSSGVIRHTSYMHNSNGFTAKNNRDVMTKFK